MPPVVSFPIDVTQFWSKTPKELKYLLLIAIIVFGSYLLFMRMPASEEIKELTKIEQNIAVTYELVDKFEKFQTTQIQFNEYTTQDIQYLYDLILELNQSVSAKNDYIIQNSGKYNKDLADKLKILNESFTKLVKAYQTNSNERNKYGKSGK